MRAPGALLVLILAALSAVGPFSIDTYLPAFPAMEGAFGVRPVALQQTLSAYMGTFALMTLWHGALSDSFGRRRVILVGTGLYALASLVCALAPSIEWMWFGRGLQGLCAGAGMVVSRAVIRDYFDGPQAQRLMSQVMTVFSVAPAIAPILGGLILGLASWRAIFLFLALFGLGLFLLVLWHLPETLPQDRRQPLAPINLLRGFLGILGRPRFLLLVLAAGFNFNGFFQFVLSAPVFVMGHLGLSAQEFGWLFVPAVAGMMLGSTLSGRVAGHWSPARSIATGYVIMLLAGAANTAWHAVLPAALPWSVIPVGLYTLGMSITMPSLTLLALDLFPERRGMAASVQSFIQMGVNALTAAVLAPLLWKTPLTLATGMVVWTALGLICWTQAARIPPHSPR